jgi:hypothetical protein
MMRKKSSKMPSRPLPFVGPSVGRIRNPANYPMFSIHERGKILRDATPMVDVAGSALPLCSLSKL